MLKRILAGLIAVVVVANGAAAGPSEDATANVQRGGYPTSLRLLAPLAEQGAADAQTQLGVIYRDGDGVPRDYVAAVKWLRRAAVQGYAEAQENLGASYATGRGVSQNWVLAYMWFSLAAKQAGAASAVKNRDSAAKEMTSDQLASAQRLVAEWKRTTRAAPIVEGTGPSIAPIGPAVLVTGKMQRIFDWTRDRCNKMNIPDLPVRAFRDAEGQVQLIVSNTTSYRMKGRDFDHLSIDCSPVWRSTPAADPAVFADNEWIAATYTEDGKIIYALAHDEYHGHEHGRERCPSRQYFKCWYNGITLMRSDNGGASYHHVVRPPQNLVASVPDKYVPDRGPYGVFEPSNIVRRDDFFYVFVRVQRMLSGDQYVCLMRTSDLGDAGSWRFWDGEGFGGIFTNPYSDSPGTRQARFCERVGFDQIAQMHGAVTWNTYLQKFVLVGDSSDPTAEPSSPYGFFYALSDDLVHWSKRRMLLALPLPWSVKNPNQVDYLYPSLIDPESPSRNFDTTGETAWLYFTRHNGGQPSLDRDLVRVPVRFVR